MKGDTMAKRSSFGSMMRRKLSDITNPLPQPSSFSENSPLDNVSAKEFIEHLVKEKMALVKLIQDKNKIIEMSGIEIKKLRTCLQKMQLQNWTLAQTNSQMSAELNLGKERLKSLQHEVVCKEILLKTKNLQLKEKEKVNVQKSEVKETEVVAKGSDVIADTKPCNASRRRRLSRSRSLGSSTIPQQHAEKEAVVSKRRCLRRRSTSSRSSHEGPDDDRLFEIDEAKFPDVVPSKRPTDEVIPSRLTSSSDGVTSGNRFPELETGARRTSISRPSRRAAEKVVSYKERPINIKMRRPE